MAVITLDDEAVLIDKISKGDKRAFTILFDARYKSLGSYVFKLTESVVVAEEIVQDVFVKIWLGREKLTAINNISNYLFILSRNQTLNYLRKKASDELKLKTYEMEFDQINAEDTLQTEAFRQLLDEAIARLPLQQKKIYQLSREQKLKYEEIAQQLNLSTETVKKHMYLASKTLKEYLKDHFDDIVLMILLTPFVFL